MAQPITFSAADVSLWVGRLWWPSLRIGGFIMAAPVASEMTIPSRVKLIFGLSLAFLLAPMAPSPANLSIFSGAGLLTAVQEILIGIGIGLVMALAFEALTFAGQTVSMTMGLGFSTLVDPVHGNNVTVLGQIFMIVGTLMYLSLNAHLMLLGALANSFQTLPIGAANIDKDFLMAIASWGARIFETGLLVSLPIVISLVIVNMALGVITRAAPQLNLFGIGFTITLLSGFFVLTVGLDNVMFSIRNLIDTSLKAAVELVSMHSDGVH
jgi:flagellar biosynthetic protein FliR